MKSLIQSLTQFTDWAVRFGVAGYDRETRRRLSVCNIAGYLSAVSSISFALSFMAYDFKYMKWLIAGNLFSAAATTCAPLLHRFNAVASPIALASVVATTLFFFISELGRDSGIQLNYIGSVAIAFAIFGLSHFRYVAAVTVICIVGHLASYYLFETGRVQPFVDVAMLNQIYVLSAVSIMLILGLIVWYAFSLAADAEARSERLLLNTFPSEIAERLRDEPDKIIADGFDEATVMFADIVGFTKLSRELGPEKLVRVLNIVFSEFDALSEEMDTEKIKTIGDAYMAVSGIPIPNETHAQNVIRLAVALQDAVKRISKTEGLDLKIRIGIATGPITAGVIGKAKFAYDVWSSTVNLAARLEAYGEVGRIRVSQATYQALREQYTFERLPAENLKGVGRVGSWMLIGEK